MAAKATTDAAPAKQAEVQYTVQELAAAAKAGKVFELGTSPDCVVAALRLAGKAQVTPSEAKKIVESFLKREVK